ncbi:hypothetical protein HYQ46_000634 [Verticillium longisporum]|nr:hypothetical protein HYQ46_000634 [Verticillium longisporum]
MHVLTSSLGKRHLLIDRALSRHRSCFVCLTDTTPSVRQSVSIDRESCLGAVLSSAVPHKLKGGADRLVWFLPGHYRCASSFPFAPSTPTATGACSLCSGSRLNMEVALCISLEKLAILRFLRW